MKTIYKCDFCNCMSSVKEELEAHELKCCKNPKNKCCETCNNNKLGFPDDTCEMGLKLYKRNCKKWELHK